MEKLSSLKTGILTSEDLSITVILRTPTSAISRDFPYSSIMNNLVHIDLFKLNLGSVIKEIKQPNVVMNKELVLNPASLNWRNKQSMASKKHYGGLMKRAKGKKKMSKY